MKPQLSTIFTVVAAAVAIGLLNTKTFAQGPLPSTFKIDSPSATELSNIKKVLKNNKFLKVRGIIGTDSRGLPAIENAAQKPSLQGGKTSVVPVMPVTNPEALATLPLGTPVEVTVNGVDGGAKLDNVQLQPLATWESLKTKLPAERFSGLHTARAKLAAAVEGLNKSGAMSASDSDKTVKTELRNFQMEVAKALDTERKDAHSLPKDLEEICQIFKEARDASKAFYGRLDNYSPQVYLKIYKNTESVALLARRFTGKPFPPPPPMGTGVLIGQNLLLTCNHVIKPYGPTYKDLQVSFAYDGEDVSPTNQHDVDSVVAKGRIPAHASEPLDYALLLLKPNKDNKGAHELHQPVSLSTVEVVLDDPIYVIGHPRGQSRTVHDNSFVLFPFEVNEDDLKFLRAAVCSETEGAPDRHTMLMAFVDSYQPHVEKGGFRLYSRRWAQHPAFGADCDTSSGNSGSPVFMRSTGNLCGLLFRGQPDNEFIINTPYTPGWRRHEEILPINEIVRDIQEQLGEEWVEKYGVDIK